MTNGYDWQWYKQPCSKPGLACHWRTVYKQPRRYCEDCVKEARESFKRAFEAEREVCVETDQVAPVR